VKGKEDLVCRLKNSLYGLKQPTRMWYWKLGTHVLGLGFSRNKVDRCLHTKDVGDYFVIFVSYVDDMLLIGNNEEIIKDVKSQ
jgi:hypothetical protein